MKHFCSSWCFGPELALPSAGVIHVQAVVVVVVVFGATFCVRAVLALLLVREGLLCL